MTGDEVGAKIPKALNWRTLRFHFFNIFLFYAVLTGGAYYSYHHWIKPLQKEITSLRQLNRQLASKNRYLDKVVTDWQLQDQLEARADEIESLLPLQKIGQDISRLDEYKAEVVRLEKLKAEVEKLAEGK